MADATAALVLLACVTVLNSACTWALVRRWRALAAAAHDGGHGHGHGQGHGHAGADERGGADGHGGSGGNGGAGERARGGSAGRGRRAPGPHLPHAAVGRPLPDFAAPTAGGATLAARDLTGQPLLVCFLALDCSACKKALPGLTAHSARIRAAGHRVLAVVQGDPEGAPVPTAALAAAAAACADDVIVEPLGGPVAQAFGAHVFPAFVHADPAGTVIQAGAGEEAAILRSRPVLTR